MRNLPNGAVASAIRDAYDDGDFALVAGWDVGGATSAAVTAAAGDATPAQTLALQAMADAPRSRSRAGATASSLPTTGPQPARRRATGPTAFAPCRSPRRGPSWTAWRRAPARPRIGRSGSRSWPACPTRAGTRACACCVTRRHPAWASRTRRPRRPRRPSARPSATGLRSRLSTTTDTPYDGNCHVQLPSGAETDGAPDEDGVVRIDGLAPRLLPRLVPGPRRVGLGSGLARRSAEPARRQHRDDHHAERDPVDHEGHGAARAQELEQPGDAGVAGDRGHDQADGQRRAADVVRVA